MGGWPRFCPSESDAPYSASKLWMLRFERRWRSGDDGWCKDGVDWFSFGGYCCVSVYWWQEDDYGDGDGSTGYAKEPIPAPLVDEQHPTAKQETAVFAGGCFWGVQTTLSADQGCDGDYGGVLGRDGGYGDVWPGLVGDDGACGVGEDCVSIRRRSAMGRCCGCSSPWCTIRRS